MSFPFSPRIKASLELRSQCHSCDQAFNYLLNRLQPPHPASLPFFNSGSGTALWSVVYTRIKHVDQDTTSNTHATPSCMHEHAHTDHTCTHILYAFTPAHTTYTQVCMCICIHSHMNMILHVLLHTLSQRFMCAHKFIHTHKLHIKLCICMHSEL